MNQSFDIATRELLFQNQTLTISYLTSLADGSMINEIIKGIEFLDNEDDLMQVLINGSIQTSDDKNLIQRSLLSGCCIIEYNSQSYILETRSYPSRSINEPETERTVRGSKDGFNESIITNVGLIRRRIKSEHLVMKMMNVGELSRCDICVSYLDDCVDKKLLDLVIKRFNEIDIDDLSMSDRALEELFINQSYHPFPLVRYCERPDIVATHIMKGYIAIIVDTSASVMIIPVTLFDLLEHVEEHRQTPIVGTVLRLIRLFAVFLSVYLVPIWMLMLQTPNLERFILKPPAEAVDYSNFILQIVILELSIELLRVATIHTPSQLSNAIGLVSAILLGQMAVELGIFLPEVLLYGAISSLAGFATPNYELSLANKLAKWLMIIAIVLFNNYGFVIMNFLFIMYLMHIKVFNQYYLFPLVPFNESLFFDFIIRRPKKENI